ncbi:ribose-phosphate pyrophosphokinase-like domain-containing protein [Rhodanobacter lindaniclasticus]
MNQAMQARIAPVAWRHFPDGESLVTLEDSLAGADVAILASLRHADALALPLRFAARTAREFGARSVGLIAPYLGYMRQDTRFHRGEAVSTPLFAQFLEEAFDWLVTAIRTCTALSACSRSTGSRRPTCRRRRPSPAGWRQVWMRC